GRDEWLAPTVAAMRARGFTVEGMLCDVAKPSDVQAVVEKTIAIYGKVDILINNAGVTWAAEPEDLPLDKWQKVVDVNLTGAFLFSQAAGRDMLRRRFGRIINTASIAGMHASVQGPHYGAYAASKAGGRSREEPVSVRCAPLGAALRLLGAAAHDVPRASARRHPRDHRGPPAGQSGDAFSRRGAHVPRPEGAIGRAGGVAAAAG